MSQAKVDKYKDYKKNRRENIKKEKRRSFLYKVLAWAVVVVLIAGVGTALGVSFYNEYRAKLAAMPTFSSTSFVLSDNVGIRTGGHSHDEEEPEDGTDEAETTGEEPITEEATEDFTEAETSGQTEETSQEEEESGTEKE